MWDTRGPMWAHVGPTWPCLFGSVAWTRVWNPPRSGFGLACLAWLGEPCLSVASLVGSAAPRLSSYLLPLELWLLLWLLPTRRATLRQGEPSQARQANPKPFRGGFQMVPNFPKWFPMVPNGPRWSPNGPKWSQGVPNGPLGAPGALWVLGGATGLPRGNPWVPRGPELVPSQGPFGTSNPAGGPTIVLEQRMTNAPCYGSHHGRPWKPRKPPWKACLLYTSPSPRDRTRSRMPSSA